MEVSRFSFTKKESKPHIRDRFIMHFSSSVAHSHFRLNITEIPLFYYHKAIHFIQKQSVYVKNNSVLY